MLPYSRIVSCVCSNHSKWKFCLRNVSSSSCANSFLKLNRGYLVIFKSTAEAFISHTRRNRQHYCFTGLEYRRPVPLHACPSSTRTLRMSRKRYKNRVASKVNQ